MSRIPQRAWLTFALVGTIFIVGQVLVDRVHIPVPDPLADAWAGRPAPDFELPGLDGETVRLADHRGSWVVVDFWATWCLPCREEIEALEVFHRNHPEVPILAVDQEESLPDVEAFLERTPHEHLIVLLDRDGVVSEAYGVDSLPTLLLVDPEGTVRARFHGYRPDIAYELSDAMASSQTAEPTT